MYKQFVIHVDYVMFFFFHDTATTEIYTLSLHDALPICAIMREAGLPAGVVNVVTNAPAEASKVVETLIAHPAVQDRKSTRLNSSHSQISYAVFCLKKKIHIQHRPHTPPYTLPSLNHSYI